MYTLLEILFLLAFFVLVYVNVIYSFLLKILVKFKQDHLTIDEKYTPKVSVLISAYNEESVIGQKIQNCLELNYPRNLLEIVVVSDASNDKTDDIILSFQSSGVKLIRMNERSGKTMGINRAMTMLGGDIIVFTDANSYFHIDAIKHLVKHFADARVGYVTGESIYITDNASMASFSENFYWKYESQLKRHESMLGSMVGADGAIYAIRRELYAPLEHDDINDFVNPLHIIHQGFRGIYEPEAICYEHTADDFHKEFRRKRRIVNRSWRGLLKMRQLLNPLNYGMYSIQLISHKLLRWLAPFILVLLFMLNILLVEYRPIYMFLIAFQMTFYLIAFIGSVLNRRKRTLNKWLHLPYYFCLVNLASALGIIDNLCGKKNIIWEPERK
jgi:cellulose synthase/poly-beta-1,6-N-acetylglucosamine synthase-like glycosyltransferase